jgi:hypothetical protein
MYHAKTKDGSFARLINGLRALAAPDGRPSKDRPLISLNATSKQVALPHNRLISHHRNPSTLRTQVGSRTDLGISERPTRQLVVVDASFRYKWRVLTRNPEVS